MRMIVNRDEVATFRKFLREEVDAESQTISITLKMGREDAKQILQKSSDDGPPIECIWGCGFSR